MVWSSTPLIASLLSIYFHSPPLHQSTHAHIWYSGHSHVCMLEILTEMYICLHISCLLCLSDFNQNWNGSTVSHYLQFQLYWKYVYKVFTCYIHTVGWTNLIFTKHSARMWLYLKFCVYVMICGLIKTTCNLSNLWSLSR